MAKVFYLEKFARSGAVLMVPPGQSVTETTPAFPYATEVLCFGLVTAAGLGLLIETIAIDGEKMFEGGPILAEHYLARSPAEDAALVRQLQSCFRYQDHTLEEYTRAIDLLRPSLGRSVSWVLHIGMHLSVTFRNPSAAPIQTQMLLSGEYLVLPAPARPLAGDRPSPPPEPERDDS